MIDIWRVSAGWEEHGWEHITTNLTPKGTSNKTLHNIPRSLLDWNGMFAIKNANVLNNKQTKYTKLNEWPTGRCNINANHFKIELQFSKYLASVQMIFGHKVWRHLSQVWRPLK